MSRQEDVDVIRKFLEDLDLVLTVPTYLSVEGEQPVRGRNMQIISQAGMVYSHATELLRLITSDEHWKNLKVCGLENKEKFIEKAERQIKGAILANLVIYDTYKALHENYYVTKIRRNSDGKEVNLAIVDKQYKDTYLFEVGYSQYKADNQVKNLANEEFNNYIEESFGKIKGRYVIYTGENDTLESALGEIKFFSAELFFKSVVNVNNVENLLDLLN